MSVALDSGQESSSIDLQATGLMEAPTDSFV